MPVASRRTILRHGCPRPVVSFVNRLEYRASSQKLRPNHHIVQGSLTLVPMAARDRSYSSRARLGNAPERCMPGGSISPALGVHAPPLDLSTTYPLSDVDAAGHSYESMAARRGPDRGRAGLRPALEPHGGPVRVGARDAGGDSRRRSPSAAAWRRLTALISWRAAERPTAHRRRSSAVRRHGPPAGDRAARHRGDLGPAGRDRRLRSARTPGWSSARRRRTPPSNCSTSRDVVAQAGRRAGDGGLDVRHTGAAAARPPRRGPGHAQCDEVPRGPRGRGRRGRRLRGRMGGPAARRCAP